MNRKAESILNNTVRLLLENGVKKTSMDEIAEHSRVSKVTVYKYFSDKDTLLESVGLNLLTLHTNKLQNIISSETSLKKQLFTFLDAVSAFSDSGHFSLCEELRKYCVNVENAWAHYSEVFRNTLLALIETGLQEGRLKTGLGLDIIYHYINMSVSYYQKNASYREKLHADDTFRRQLMQFYIANIFIDPVTLSDTN